METLDLLIVGGSIAGVTAAVDAKKNGLSVALTTHRSYLGEDICDSLRLAVPTDTDTSDPLVSRLFGPALADGTCLRPMHVKHELDLVLQEADIPAVLCAAPGQLRYTDGLLSLTLYTRSGSRTLKARRILDATVRGDLARLAGIPLSSPRASVTITRRVIAGQSEGHTEWTPEGSVEFEADTGSQRETLWSHTYETRLENGSWAAWMEMEQTTRPRAYRPGQLQSADGIEARTGERLHPDTPVTRAHGRVQDIPASAVVSHGNRLAFAGDIISVDDPTLDILHRPDGSVAWGHRLIDLLNETRPESTDLPQVHPEEHRVDVLVLGGGTGGAPAAIGASRSGVKTLVAEVLSGLGGVGTLGLIGRYWFGNRVGFTAEIDAGAKDRSSRVVENGWDIEAKMQWYHEQITKAGGQIWYKTAMADVLTESNRILGAVLITPQGPVQILAGCTVDATGSGHVAARAGAETVSIGQGSLALQGTGLPGRTPGQDYRNTDYDFIDESNDSDAQSAHVTARRKFKNAFDAGQHIDSRERQRIVGDIEITPMDIRLKRVFPDTIVKARSNFDTHGYTLHPLFMIVPPDHDALEAYIPLRALLPRGLDGVLVTGLGISAHRDAMPVIRMQADVQNQGYAAGVIAARCPEGLVRNLDIDRLQAHLVDMGILDSDVRGAADSFPLSETEITQSLQKAPTDPNQIDRVFTLPDSERDARLRKAFQTALDEPARRFFAFVLGILQDATGVDCLLNEVAESDWDEGWNYTGMGQFGASMSPLDARIIALGRCGDVRAVDVLGRKADDLPADAAFSHFRALAEALTALQTPSAAPTLEALLSRPGISGHAILTQSDRDATATDDACETSFRNRSLIELHLATALVRLDPGNSTARKVLHSYSRDLRSLFAHHAKELLSE